MTSIRIQKHKPASVGACSMTAPASSSAYIDTPCLTVAAPDLPVPAELLTVAEAAAYAKVCHHTIRRWIKSGGLVAFDSGHRIRIDRSAVVKFLCNSGDQ